MKSVQNLIFYLHKFFWNFSQFLAICFELFLFEVIFNSEITDERAPPVRRRVPRRARTATRRCRVAATCRAVARGLKPLSGQRATRPNSPASRAPPSPRPPRTRRPTDRQRPGGFRPSYYRHDPARVSKGAQNKSKETGKGNLVLMKQKLCSSSSPTLSSPYPLVPPRFRL
jgi:hypothetical protein